MTDSSPVVAFDTITRPLPLLEIFDPKRPIDVDIGCGKGRFLIGRAKNHPDRQILGIERLKGRVASVAKKIKRAGCSNARLIRLEAFYSVAYLLPEASIDQAFVLFPDPWPKRKHARRRLFRAEFLTTLARKLRLHGCVHIATDHLDYFAEIRTLFESDSRYQSICPYRRDASEQTDFERLFRAKGLPVAEASYQLTAAPDDQAGATMPLPPEPRAERKPSDH